MKRALLCFSMALAGATTQAHAVGRLADVVLVDRSTGATLPIHVHQGDYWVAGQPGARYAISVRNLSGERVLAVMSVDGVNVLSGETASWEQTGYVFNPWLQYQVTGWRKSNTEVAAFEFSAAADSYAGRTGRPDQVGVIGVALFRERLPEPVAQAPAVADRAAKEPAAPAAREKSASAGADLAERGANAPAPSGGSLSLRERRIAAAPALPTPQLGTAHGQREASLVSQTRFERLQARPSEIIRIRYDSRENLVASGVIRGPLVRPPRPDANPFPMSDQAVFVPDPPALRY